MVEINKKGVDIAQQNVMHNNIIANILKCLDYKAVGVCVIILHERLNIKWTVLPSLAVSLEA